MNIPERAIDAAKEAGDSIGIELTSPDIEALLKAAAPHMLTRITNHVINRAYEDGRRAALEEAADEAEAVIALGDVAECAAHVPGESGRHNAVAARDELNEDPVSWLRNYAATSPCKEQS